MFYAPQGSGALLAPSWKAELLFCATYLVLLPQMRKNVLDTPVLSPPSALVLRGSLGRCLRSLGAPGPDLAMGAA